MRTVARGGIVVNHGGQPGHDSLASPAEIPMGWFISYPGALLYGLDIGGGIAPQGGGAPDLAQLAVAPVVIVQLRQRVVPGKIVILIGAGED